MAGLHELIPGLAKAERDYQTLQIEGFLGVEDPIAGIEVLPFTPRMFLELDYAGNRCLGEDRSPHPLHVEQFLWRVSAGFDRVRSDAKVPGSPRRLVVAAMAASGYVETVDEIHAYLYKAWAVKPQPIVKARVNRPGARLPPKSAGTWVSSLVDAVACQYGWTEAEILDCPFRRLWQYANRILERHVPEFAQICPEAMELRAQWLEEANRRN